MPLPERILVDTSAFYALVSANDSFHQGAESAHERLIDRENAFESFGGCRSKAPETLRKPSAKATRKDV